MATVGHGCGPVGWVSTAATSAQEGREQCRSSQAAIQLDASQGGGGADTGIAVAMVYQDKVVYLKGFGVRAVGKPETVDPDKVFQLVSPIGRNTSLALFRYAPDLPGSAPRGRSVGMQRATLLAARWGAAS